MTPVSLTTASQITTEQLQSVLACALQRGSVSCVCCESHVALGIFMPAFSKWQNKTSSLKNTNGHCSHTRTHTQTHFDSLFSGLGTKRFCKEVFFDECWILAASEKPVKVLLLSLISC